MDLIDITVVKVPDPAIKGNAIGTIEPALALLSPLKNSMPNTISRPRINNTIEPAIANELMSSPINRRKRSPKKKNNNISKPETKVALRALIWPILFFSEINTGIEPSTSITANKAKLAVSISENEIFDTSYKVMAQR